MSGGRGNGHGNGFPNGNGKGGGAGAGWHPVLPSPGEGARNAAAPGNGDALTRRRRASAYRLANHKPRKRSVLRVFLVTLAVFSGMGTAAIAVVYAGYNSFRTQLPSADTVAALEPPQDSYVYDSAGNLLKVFDADSKGAFRHAHVALADVSPWVKLATIDVEDRHFYDEGSWDIPRLIAAGVNDITHKGSTQGASTITEQLAKNVLEGSNLLGPTSPRSLDYKLKQIVLGNELATNFSKDQVLEMYLNRIFYGNHALGIETAAELYFGKPAKALDLAESAMLSGLPQSPTLYDPTNKEPGVDINPLAKTRQRVVLQAMVTNGDIGQAQATTAYAEKLLVHNWREAEPNPSPWFIDFLKGWLQKNFGDTFENPGGWRIYTTLDSAKQKSAEDIVRAYVQKNRRDENMNDGSLVSLDPKTGAVLTMVGAWDRGDDQIGNLNMTTELVNPGSTIKLFTYTSAIASGKFTMTTPIVDAPYTFKAPGQKDYSPLDYDRRWHGTCQLKQCLGNSFNMPAVKVEAATGIPYITNVELAMGVSHIMDRCGYKGETQNVLPTQFAATLGGLGCGISLLDLADGAATIADLGVHHDPVPVTKITDIATGKTLFTYDAQRAGRRVIPENVAFILDAITSNDNNRVQEFGRNGALTFKDGRRVSAKTGTADFFLDNLTVGWTPDLLTASWVGSPQPSCLQFKDYATMQNFIRRGRIPDGGLEKDVSDPFTAQELRALGLQPIPDRSRSCGHLTNTVSGVSGAAPIWNDFMSAALKGTPQHWYTMPADVIQVGSGGDNADFFLPSARGNSGTCYYWGAAPDPNNPCQYTGASPPPGLVPPTSSPNPGPASTPPPGAPFPTSTVGPAPP